MYKFSCKECNKIFISEKKNRIFCSNSCSLKYNRRNNIVPSKKRKGIIKRCIVCNKEYYIPQFRNSISKYCSRKCLAKQHLKKYVSIYGFKKSNKPKHIYKYIITPEGQRMREHRYVMECFLNRKLNPDEHVHHIDGNSFNNDIKNLIVLTNSEHQKLELKLKQ